MQTPVQKRASQKYRASEKGQARCAEYGRSYASTAEHKAKRAEQQRARRADPIKGAVVRAREREKRAGKARRLNGCVDGPLDERRAGNCEVCGAHADPSHFDHCHATGKFRGWLCMLCNIAAGCLRDSPELAMSLATWLGAHGLSDAK